ncbi:MAG TPA: CHAT domain-containing protein [Coleofasciculaceae cyanobacterium]
MNSNIKKILILAANPKNSTPLRLDEEVREINDALKLAKNRDDFEVIQQWAVRPRDMQRAVLESEPRIVHFSGHGMGTGGLAMEDNAGQAKLVGADALAKMFELCADQVECVLLNACYSEVQAEAIAQHIPYVIGMNEAVGDRAALEFAVGFYDALGAGRSIERAFKEGCLSIQMAGIAEHLTPVLRRKGDGISSRSATAEPTDEAIADPRKLVPIELPSSDQPAAFRTPVQLDEPEGQMPLDSQFYIERPQGGFDRFSNHATKPL